MNISGCDKLISAVYLMVLMGSFLSPMERKVVLYCKRNYLAYSNSVCVCVCVFY